MLTIGDIASRAGVAKGTVFLHYGTKPALYAEAVRAAAGPFVRAMREAAVAEASFATVAETWILTLGGASPQSRLLRSPGDAAGWANGAFEAFWLERLRQREAALGRPIPRKRQRARFVVAALAGIVATRFDDRPDRAAAPHGELARFVERAALDDL